MTKPQSLFEIWNLYKKEISANQPQKEAHATLSRTKTALLRYTLPGWGFAVPKGKKLTDRETETALNNMKGISLEQFQEADQTQQLVFDLQQVPSNSHRTYRAALKKLLEWCEQQPWWSKSINISEKRFSSANTQKKSAVDVRVTKRKYKNSHGELIQPFKYGLGAVEGETIPEKLQQELKHFQRFRTEPNSSNPEKIVRQSTVEQDLKHIRLFLGWLHRYRGVPLEEMSLQQMVKVPSEWSPDDQAAIAQAKETAAETVNLACEYIAWLKADPQAERPEDKGRGIQSPYTEISVLKTFLVVAKFLYHSCWQFCKVTSSKEVPAIKLLQNKLSTTQEKIWKPTPISDESKKWLNWTDFLSLVEKLKHECTPRILQEGQSHKNEIIPGSSRSLTAIARSYQRFIFAALLAYLPPQRQQVYRNLKIGHFKEFNNQNNSEDTLEISGYLYKNSDQWYIHLLPDIYKTGKKYNDLAFKIPNIHYSNEKNFYQYLDEWIVEYIYQNQDGDLEKINGLRRLFKPQHNYLFLKKNGKKYTHPTEFSNLLRIPAYRISGKALTPHLLNQSLITYMVEHQVKVLMVSGLGYLTRYSNEDLRNYDMWVDISEIYTWINIAQEVAQNFVHQGDE